MTNYKKSKIKYSILFILHNIVLYLILAGFLIASFVNAERDTKIVMTVGLLTELAFILIAAFSHKKLKSAIWLLITIIYAGIPAGLLVPLIIVTIYTALDELLFHFFYKKFQKEYRDLRTLNKHDEDRKHEEQDIRGKD